jgi:hypothetical protein
LDDDEQPDTSPVMGAVDFELDADERRVLDEEAAQELEDDDKEPFELGTARRELAARDGPDWPDADEEACVMGRRMWREVERGERRMC